MLWLNNMELFKDNQILQARIAGYVLQEDYEKDLKTLLTLEDFAREQKGILYVIRGCINDRISEIRSGGKIYKLFHKKELKRLYLLLDLIIQLDHRVDKRLDTL